MADFARGNRIDLNYSVQLRAVQVDGTVDDVTRAPTAGQPARDVVPGTLPDALARTRQPDDAAQVLGSAAERVGMRPVLTVPLRDLKPRRGPAGGRGSAAGTPHVELTVPAPRDDEGQVILEIDDTGVARWHLSETAAGGRTDRAGPTQTFRIPVERIDVPDVPATQRGVLGFGLRKTLHVIRFPVEAVAARAGELAVAYWESRQRPYGLGLVTQDTVLEPLTGDGVPATRLAELADQPFLLLVHGTFSRGRSAFYGLVDDAALFADLCERYPGRVLVFDHPTLHVDPDANAAWLLDRFPSAVPLTFDVVSHSRGGLVARGLGTKTLADAAGRPTPTVRTLVHVATPNAGTILASPDRLGTLLDVFTNVLSLFPDSPAGVAIEGVLEVVKQVATGVLGGLDGLAAMDPASDWLRTLDTGVPASGTALHGVTSNYQPGEGASLAARALNVLVDRVFGADNDLVVPTDGVCRAGGYQVSNPLVVPTADAVTHTHYFGDAEVRQAISGWLPRA